MIVETVGAGQSETRIAALADTRVVVCPPGLGDDVQAIKAGMLEIADVLAVSKGDLPLAEQTAREMREMLACAARARRAHGSRASSSSARCARSGIDELLAAIDAHRAASASAAARGGATPGARLRRACRSPTPTAAPLDAAAGAPGSPALAARDGLCATLGISVLAGGPGRAEVAMTVDARHLNFNGGCHGGAIFSLADTRVRPGLQLARPARRGHRRAHHLPGRRSRAGDTLVARAAR